MKGQLCEFLDFSAINDGGVYSHSVWGKNQDKTKGIACGRVHRSSQILCIACTRHG